MSSIRSRGCIFDCLCVLSDLTRLPLLGGRRKSWYIIVIIIIIIHIHHLLNAYRILVIHGIFYFLLLIVDCLLQLYYSGKASAVGQKGNNSVGAASVVAVAAAVVSNAVPSAVAAGNPGAGEVPGSGIAGVKDQQADSNSATAASNSRTPNKRLLRLSHPKHNCVCLCLMRSHYLITVLASLLQFSCLSIYTICPVLKECNNYWLY